VKSALNFNPWTLCIDILRTFSCIIRVFNPFVLLTVHLCAIDTRFNKCNLLTYLLKFQTFRQLTPPPVLLGQFQHCV